jgi:hypothetical protein
MPVEFRVLPLSLRMEIAQFFSPNRATLALLARIRAHFAKLPPTQPNRAARLRFEMMASPLVKKGLHGMGEYFAPSGMGEYFSANGLGADPVDACDAQCADKMRPVMIAIGAVSLGVGLAVATVAFR